MTVSTPSRSSSDARIDNADFTRPQDPESPSNLRTAKRPKNSQGHLPPPILQIGGSVSNLSATAAVRSQLEEDERRAKIKREVFGALATTVDQFVASCKQPEKRALALDICGRFIQFVATSDYAANDGADYVPLRVRSNPTASTKSVTWAGIAQTGKNSYSGADFRTTAVRAPQGKRPASSQSSDRSRSTLSSGQREDRRVLITMESHRLLARPEPYAVRRAICESVEGLTSAAAIPRIEPTRTGWAITPADLATHDALVAPAAVQALCQAIGATSVCLPEKWYNYAVRGVPATIRAWDGSHLQTCELIEDEIIAQTQQRPKSVRPSRHGANPDTGMTTWIVSFLKPVHPFSLFNSSDRARLIDKKQPITRHDPGCQGYCHPARCTRAQRCAHCGTRTDSHDGPGGPNCTHAPRCANCHGPFPAGHDNCPAAPRRHQGVTKYLTKKELAAVRRYGDRCYRDANSAAAAQAADATGDSPPSTPSLAAVPADRAQQSQKKRGANAQTPMMARAGSL